MLRADLDAPRKQRHTARRVLARLVGEHDGGELRYSTVRDYLYRRRPEIAAEAGRGLEQAFVGQSHLPAAEAEVDFGDVWVELAGESTKCFLFTFRLSYSGKAIHRVFASQGQDAFIEGHVAAFETLGGVPVSRVRNLAQIPPMRHIPPLVVSSSVKFTCQTRFRRSGGSMNGGR